LRCNWRIYGLTGAGLQEGWFRPLGVCEWSIPRREEAFAEEHKEKEQVQQNASGSFQCDEAGRGGWSGETEEGPEHFEVGNSETEAAAGEFACSAHKCSGESSICRDEAVSDDVFPHQNG